MTDNIIATYKDSKGNDCELYETHKTLRNPQCENCYYTPDNPSCRCKGIYPMYCPNMQEELLPCIKNR